MRLAFLPIFIILICGCSSEEPMVSSGEPVNEESEYIYRGFNQWVYQQMNHSYLWREDLPDSVSCDYDVAPNEFFKSLLSTKDRFSYFINNPNYSNSNEYGFAYQRYRYQGRKDIYEILYIKNPELRTQGMRRGDVIDIKTKNGHHVYSKLNISNDYVNDSGIKYTEHISTRAIKNTETVLLDSVYEINGKKIGYICYLEFDNVCDLNKSFIKMYNSQIEELIIDLRYNPGGYLNTCQYLCNCIISSNGYNDIFQKCCYNDIISEEYLKATGLPYTLSKYETPTALDGIVLGTSITPLNQKRVYFLTSKHTASASEAAIICLRPYMDVIVIGETTVGKGVGSWTISDSKYKYAIQPITMRYYNALDETTPDDGITPDYYIADGYLTSKREIGDLEELLLNTAINIILENPNKIRNKDGNKLSTPSSNTFIPIDEPSYVIDFRNRQFNNQNTNNL